MEAIASCRVDRGRRGPEGEAVGEAFVTALAEGDFHALAALLAADLRLRLLVPKGAQEEAGATAALERFVTWFADAAEVGLEASSVDVVADRLAVGYRFRLRKPEGWRLVEQRLVADLDEGGRLAAIDLLCTGFRPLAAAHRLDVGDRGCTNGLAAEFRRAIDAIPVGDVLAVTVRDAAAKEDLPPLARLMGHVVRSIEPCDGGGLVITVERGR